MARTMDATVRDMLGAQQLLIAQLQVQVEDLTEQLAAAKKAAEHKLESPLHRVPRDDREVG